MIKITKQNNSLIVEGVENAFYPNNGDNSYPLNSLIVVTDNSDMATFRSVATNDVLFSGLINNIIINGEVVTKDNIIDKFDAVSNSSDVYTKEETDNKFASKDELVNVQTVANNADTKVDALTTRVEGVETVANNADAKADAATSKVEGVETALGNKQDTLVSGTNIKTVNSQSILGEGNIEVSGGTKIYDASEMPKNFKNALYQAAYEAYYTRDKIITIDKSTDVEEFLSNLKTGDYLQLDTEVLIQYYGFIRNYTYKFAIKTGKETTDIHQYGRLITVMIIGNMFYIENNASGPVLQKNDLKTINGENIVGSGNIEISGGISDEQAQEIAKIPTLETSLNNKQDTLVSGTNIKTINSQSILGEGNIEVTIPDATTATSGAMSAADKTKLDSISNEWTGTQSEFDALTTKDDNIIYYVTE